VQYFADDDIAQIASPPGAGLLGAIRLSGPNVFAILAEAVIPTNPAAAEALAARRRGAHQCDLLLTLSGHRLSCPANVMLMPGPGSYTREDVAEFHLPGSPVVLRAALRTLTRLGARPAAPGEFTFRAFRNGRLSLGQAEAVEESIRATAENRRRMALFRMGDANPHLIGEWRRRVLDAAAIIEASIDFEHEHLGGDPAAEIAALVEDLEQAGAALAEDSGIARPDLPLVSLLGLTNAGKSALANALLGQAEFVVSPQPSTTRDRLQREVKLGNVTLLLADNPGHDPVSRDVGGDAAARGQKTIGAEDLACWVVDGSEPAGQPLREFAARLGEPILVLVNKRDLPAKTGKENIVRILADVGKKPVAALSVSAHSGEGIAEAKQTIARIVGDSGIQNRWNRRERTELSTALLHLRAAALELSGLGREELVADDLRSAVDAFSGALGEGYVEETLTAIFSQFCLGK
jgi:tRNA modification GTPase